MLRNVLDTHSAQTQKVRLQRDRKYDDEIQRYDRPHPSNAPEWSYVDQSGILFDTDIELPRTDLEGYATEQEIEEELERGQTSAAGGDANDSEELIMDDE